MLHNTGPQTLVHRPHVTVLVNEALLRHDHAFIHILSLLNLSYGVALRTSNRKSIVCKAQHFYYLALYRKCFSDPGYGLQTHPGLG